MKVFGRGGEGKVGRGLDLRATPFHLTNHSSRISQVPNHDLQSIVLNCKHHKLWYFISVQLKKKICGVNNISHPANQSRKKT